MRLPVEGAQPGRGLSLAQPLITCQNNRRVLPWFLTLNNILGVYLVCPPVPLARRPLHVGPWGPKSMIHFPLCNAQQLLIFH